jgi:hypothetical protein
MTRIYGLDEDTWKQAKAEVLAILISSARDRSLITYGEITDMMLAAKLSPGSYVFTGLLRDVCREEFERNGIQLCALVVSKASGKPGAGYYRSLLCEGELDDCWQQEYETVFDFYSEKKSE